MRQPLRGFVAQGMDGRKRGGRPPRYLGIFQKTEGGPGTQVSPPVPSWCEVFLIGAGGGVGSGANVAGGGGAGAAKKRFYCPPNTSIPYVVGEGGSNADGGDSFVQTPSGVRVIAQGGKSTGNGRAGGYGSGGDAHRRGGDGGNVGSPGLGGEGGGSGGSALSGNGGGGGAAGFNDYGATIESGNGGGGAANPGPGGGGRGLNGPGGRGRITFVFTAA
jgi:hypothetical protein